MNEHEMTKGYGPQVTPIETPKTELVIKAVDSLADKIPGMIDRLVEATQKLYGPDPSEGKDKEAISGETKRSGFFGELFSSIKKTDYLLDDLEKAIIRLTDKL